MTAQDAVTRTGQEYYPHNNTLSPAHWRLLGGLYITPYLGVGFFLTALVAILRKSGASLETVSIVYLLGLVWAVKFLWAPLVDRWKSSRLGHFRAWLLSMQSLMIISLLLIGCFDPVREFSTVYSLCLLLSLASATQNIAVNGLAYRLAPVQHRGHVNGLQAAGGLLGNMLGAGAVLMAYPHLGWSGCTLLLAAGCSVPLTQSLFFKEPVFANLPAAAPSPVFKQFRSLFLQAGQRRWLLMLLLYPLGVSLGYALITPILVDSGWELDRIGLVVNIVGNLCGIPAALLTGRCIRRYGRRPMLLAAAAIQVPGILILLVPLAGTTATMPVMLAVGLFFFCYNPAVAVLTTLMMDQANPAQPASDYASQYSLYMLFSIIAVTLGTAVAGQVGYRTVLGAAAACALLMAPFAWKYRLNEPTSPTVAQETQLSTSCP